MLFWLLKFKFKLLRRYYDGEPSPEEVTWALCQNVEGSYRIKRYMYLYAKGYQFNHIADMHGITRERVRACIRKGVYQAYGN